MSIQWVTSTAALPMEGQSVEFHLDYRETALGGAHLQNAFQTRWGVRNWRSPQATIRQPSPGEAAAKSIRSRRESANMSVGTGARAYLKSAKATTRPLVRSAPSLPPA
jgi:hypothetical protein